MAWESFTNFTQDTGVSNSGWVELGTITTTPREIINVMIGADNESGSVTDALLVQVVVARDDTPTNYTDVPVFETSYLPDSVSQKWFPFSLTGYKHYKVETQSAGATDDYTVDGTYRGDGVDA